MDCKHLLYLGAIALSVSVFGQNWDLSTPGQITTTDKVGIGTSTPASPLEIRSSDPYDLIIQKTATNDWARLILKRSSDPNHAFIQYYGNTTSGMTIGTTGINPIRFYNNDIERMRIAGNGNVGIGTFSPGTWFTGKVFEVSDNRPVLKLTSNGDLATIQLTDSSVDPVSRSGEFHWNYRYNDASPEESTVAFHAYPYGSVLGIQANGMVGIGNHTPKEALDVSGNIKFGKSHVTDFNLVSDGHGGAHALLFNAYKSTNANGWLSSETNHSNSAGAYGGGAGAIVFYGNGGTMDFWISPTSTGANDPVSWGDPKMRINRAGEVGIGTTDVSGYRLSVAGNIRAEEIKVEASPWPDYVFEEDYDLRSLEETEAYIKANKHLPEIPSAKEMEAHGVQLGEMNRLLLKKIEELTLHLIQKEKEIHSLKDDYQKEIETLTRRIEKIERISQ